MCVCVCVCVCLSCVRVRKRACACEVLITQINNLFSSAPLLPPLLSLQAYSPMIIYSNTIWRPAFSRAFAACLRHKAQCARATRGHGNLIRQTLVYQVRQASLRQNVITLCSTLGGNSRGQGLFWGPIWKVVEALADRVTACLCCIHAPGIPDEELDRQPVT